MAQINYHETTDTAIAISKIKTYFLEQGKKEPSKCECIDFALNMVVKSLKYMDNEDLKQIEL